MNDHPNCRCVLPKYATKTVTLTLSEWEAVQNAIAAASYRNQSLARDCFENPDVAKMFRARKLQLDRLCVILHQELRAAKTESKEVDRVPVNLS